MSLAEKIEQLRTMDRFMVRFENILANLKGLNKDELLITILLDIDDSLLFTLENAIEAIEKIQNKLRQSKDELEIG